MSDWDEILDREQDFRLAGSELSIAIRDFLRCERKASRDGIDPKKFDAAQRRLRVALQTWEHLRDEDMRKLMEAPPV